jgi:predicted RNase H-like HicB family nuclease
LQREIQVPFTIAEDHEDGGWIAAAALNPEAFANGEGETREEAIEDLKAALIALVDEVGIPEQLVVTLDVD